MRARGQAARSWRPLRVGSALLLVVIVLGLESATAVAAMSPETAGASPAPPATTPVPSDLPERPDDYEISAVEALRIADTDPLVGAERERAGALRATVEAEAVRLWEVGYFADGSKEVLIVVDGVTGEIVESWNEDQVLWPMARGREGQFGHVLNSPWVWIPMALVFLMGLVDWRRPRKIVHLDLLVLLSFGLSHIFFNRAEIGVSVALYYPPLAYLLARMLWIGFRGVGRGTGISPSAPTAALVVACVLLAGFRVGMNVFDSGVIDVGYAGVVGADKIADADAIYGEGAFPENNPTGDTYGPANYFAYVPFEQVFPWSGSWDALPAARAAAIGFDLLSLAGLALLGWRLSGRRLAAIFAFAWLAYPYTAFVLQSNANDSLVAALLIWSLVAFAEPLARGALLAAAALTKFAPLALAPLYLAGERGLLSWRPERRYLRPVLLYGGGFVVAAMLFLAHPAIEPGLATFWDRTIGSQGARESPFSLWGQTGVELPHTIAKAAVVALALTVALVPRERSFAQIAALGAAVVIAMQVVLEHWFYLYIVWFLPLLLVAIIWRQSEPGEGEGEGSPASPNAPLHSRR
ncbi:MAG: hypothetical protein ACR2K6_11370 [Solirubrobacterales bacterium]